MRWLAAYLLLTVSLGVFIPSCPTVMIADQGAAAIGSLDVCHGAAPADKGHQDMPCVSLGIFLPFQTVHSKVFHPRHSPMPLFLLDYLNEHPPTA